jgi:hypothetical protein
MKGKLEHLLSLRGLRVYVKISSLIQQSSTSQNFSKITACIRAVCGALRHTKNSDLYGSRRMLPQTQSVPEYNGNCQAGKVRNKLFVSTVQKYAPACKKNISLGVKSEISRQTCSSSSQINFKCTLCTVTDLQCHVRVDHKKGNFNVNWYNDYYSITVVLK